MGQTSSSSTSVAAYGYGDSSYDPSSSYHHSLPNVALHVLRVAPGSPADQAGIQPFFDYLIGVEVLNRKSKEGARGIEDRSKNSAECNGEAGDTALEDAGLYEEPIGLNLDTEELVKVLDENEERPIGLRVYNSKFQRVRYVTLTPSRQWVRPQAATSDNDSSSPTAASSSYLGPSLLGLSLRLCDPTEALGQVWHILDVLDDSPAESAGLVPHGDYVIGWADGTLESENDFYELVEEFMDKPLRLYVYSADLDTIREVVLIPNRHWGGEGLLGCGVGYGLLHRIPIPPTSLSSSVPLGVTNGRRKTEPRPIGTPSPASNDDQGYNRAAEAIAT